ncbi:unnamed protein product [Dovyalis caffra]|uniref:C2H2-type domain-containing protein n=1 Tax=Dovyalis caffra TaxID=77055 RepID=A0AAV1RZ61_9ROSI|nr:unnamed protein product [Dovyalis caffra]
MAKDNDTRSDERTVTSKLRSGYICTYCDREFNSGHALGGHYNAHSKKRKRKNMPTTVGRLIRVPVPATDVESPATPRHESGSTQSSSTLEVQSGVNYESGEESSSTRPLGGLGKNLKVNIGSHHSHPYERDVKEEAPQNGRLPNTMTPMHGVRINNGVNADLEITITSPIFKVSRKENGDTKFISSNKNGNEDLDLELRLGFGPV